MPPAFMNAAWAPQPHPLTTFVSKITRLLVQVESWVPEALDQMVVEMSQCFLPLVVKAHACDRRSECYSWIALVEYSDALSQFLN
jgi:hypothetical protein